MSYCVNCGVELDNSILKCPLCDTPVINPNVLKNEQADPAFPARIEIPVTSKHKYTAIIMSVLLLIPNVICVITNLIFAPHIPWFIYVVSSSLLIWFLFMFPFIMKRKYPYLILMIDTIVTAAYIFVFYYYNSEHTGWFWKLAIPLDIGVFLCVGLLTAFFSKPRTKTRSVIALLTALTALCIYICLIINLYAYNIIATYITLIIGASCLILLIFFTAVDKNIKLHSWLSRKFFY